MLKKMAEDERKRMKETKPKKNAKPNEMRSRIALKQWRRIYEVLKPILGSERTDTVHKDEELVEIVRQKGVYCTINLLIRTRKYFKIPAMSQRKYDLFGK